MGQLADDARLSRAPLLVRARGRDNTARAEVMPQGTRVGLIHRTRPVSVIVCYRCGQTFDRHLQKMPHGVPCKDCREYLTKEEGVKTRWRHPERDK